jgi:photosynthetic reaction center cytochrome c subunit
LARELNYDDRDVARLATTNTPPAVIPPLAPSPKGPSPWKNVQVLTDVDPGEVTRTMLAMTAWVAPKTGPRAGCAYCHTLSNLASDSIYAKVVARRMLQMVRHVNSDWTSHVGQTGVTCYTCHRGSPRPNGLWWYTDENQVLRHLMDRTDSRVETPAPYPQPALNRSSVKQTLYTYSLMLNISGALGVNCTFCHNTRQFSSWGESSVQRVVALHGMQMARDLNQNFLTPLQPVFPDSVKGPLGDAPKLQCLTCHNGVYKPLFGAHMVKDYPALWGGPSWPTASATVDTGAVAMATSATVPPPLPAPSGR